ncbi:hypothetical protein MCANUFG4_03125 [Mycoplasmopsis canis UFG4]|uniref:Uncharacterized protein n=1 Tax=Mycoplasmopsis canis UFG4 TaxID=1131455 RepID=I1A4N1_9BACT|nr:hypothetical protein [Mycoplasmopsis canis]AKF41350.1 hypothetical protein AAW50_02935 [Mycoplasmopsis canis]EIE41302.1 hypothetical protein MCANUFG1_03105 [Mycoplasmopsis canis UFG1]EIE41452.1 hypothetical protein MCANUFG4_03125 [Mycoplasmopsis canis UFG4]WQQ12135.1 hypothetical protein RRG48_01915 [Mycoplasmopsis canis]
MKLKFKSLINQNDDLKTIEFTVPVMVYDEDSFKVFVFDEPNTNLKSMIEISDDEINIHTNTSTIFLKHQKEYMFNFYFQNNGKEFAVPWKTFWDKKDFFDNTYVFSYWIESNGIKIGDFEITLIIEE